MKTVCAIQVPTAAESLLVLRLLLPACLAHRQQRPTDRTSSTEHQEIEHKKRE